MQRRTLLAAIGTIPLGGLAGCTGDGGGTPTGTPTSPSREFPYTAASPSANVSPRDFTLSNRTPQEYEATVRITDREAGRTVLERTVTLPGEEDHVFEEVIGKVGTYGIRFSLAVGTQKRYEWPIDDSNGDASISIAEGDSPTDPVIWFSIDRL